MEAQVLTQEQVKNACQQIQNAQNAQQEIQNQQPKPPAIQNTAKLVTHREYQDSLAVQNRLLAGEQVSRPELRRLQRTLRRKFPNITLAEIRDKYQQIHVETTIDMAADEDLKLKEPAYWNRNPTPELDSTPTVNSSTGQETAADSSGDSQPQTEKSKTSESPNSGTALTKTAPEDSTSLPTPSATPAEPLDQTSMESSEKPKPRVRPSRAKSKPAPIAEANSESQQST